MNNVVTLNNGLVMPSLGLGGWKVEKSIAADVFYEALKAGYRHIDSAHCYGNEKEIGQGIKRAITDGIVKREDFWVTSKVWNTDHQNVAAALDVILSDLQLEYLDLLLVHWPVSWVDNSRKIDETITLVDVWKQMEAVLASGKVKSIGVSNFVLSQIKDLIANCTIVPAMNQIESHIFFSQHDFQLEMEELGIKFTSYSIFNNRPADPNDPLKERQDPFTHPVVVKIAQKHNREAGDVLIRYHMDLGRVALTRTMKPERLAANMKVLDFNLDKQDLDDLLAIRPQMRGYNPYDFLGDSNSPPTPFWKD